VATPDRTNSSRWSASSEPRIRYAAAIAARAAARSPIPQTSPTRRPLNDHRYGRFPHRTQPPRSSRLLRPRRGCGLGRPGRVYLNEIGKVALLTAADEFELAKRIEAGLYAQHLLAASNSLSASPQARPARARLDGDRAKTSLRANLSSPWYRWQALHRHGMPFLDLIQEGNLGLIRASRSSTTPRASSSRRTRRGGSGRRSAGPLAISRARSGCRLPGRAGEQAPAHPARANQQLGREATPPSLPTNSTHRDGCAS